MLLLAFSSRIRACHLGNLSDLEKTAEYQSYYYADAVEGDRDHD